MAALAAPPAAAHVGSSPRANNRYITLVPEPGAVRVVYTLIFGDSPGAAARKRMDSDGDGALSADEQRAFGDSIAAVIAAGLDIELDGEPVELAWDQVDVGLASTGVEGGELSVNLAGVVCTGGGAEHALRLTDAFRVPPVGEGALAVEPSGVEVLRSAMGEGQGTRRAFKWIGRGPIAENGHTLAIRAPEGAKAPPECARPSSQTSGRRAAAGAPEATRGSDGGGPGRGAVGVVALGVAVALIFAGRTFSSRARRRR